MSNPNKWNQQVIKEFRANDGVVGGRYKDMTLLLLHTTGAKSGKERINPLATMADGDDYIIIASKGGAPRHPDWYHNLVANPQIEVEVGSERFPALAQVVNEPERSQLFARMAAKHPFFAEYAQKAGRIIPVIRLKKRS
jgi:deazaflavin-dependent oxidoreductase (nitroreductase family)